MKSTLLKASLLALAFASQIGMATSLQPRITAFECANAEVSKAYTLSFYSYDYSSEFPEPRGVTVSLNKEGTTHLLRNAVADSELREDGTVTDLMASFDQTVLTEINDLEGSGMIVISVDQEVGSFFKAELRNLSGVEPLTCVLLID